MKKNLKKVLANMDNESINKMLFDAAIASEDCQTIIEAANFLEPDSPEQAIQLYLKLYQFGDEEGSIQYARLLLLGKGCSKSDPASALKALAVTKNTYAKLLEAGMVGLGIGTKADATKADKLLQEIIKQYINS